MKKTMTKKHFAFILLVSGMFSFTFVNAQTCPGGKILVYKCKPLGHSYPYCASRCVFPNHIPNGWGINQSSSCSSCDYRLAIEPADVELFTLAVSPNPVSGSSVIYFFLEQSEKVYLSIFDVNGRLVTNIAAKMFEEGENEIIWNATDVNAGIYFLRFETATYSENRKLIIAK